MLDDLLQLLLRLHCAQVESLDDWPRSSKLGRVIWRWRKLLDHLAAYASGRLFPPHHRAVAKVTLDEEDHFFVAYENVIAADNVQPPLYRRLQACLVLVGAGACRSRGGRHCRHNGFRACRDEVFAKLDEFRV